jgi:hypothetical protein
MVPPVNSNPDRRAFPAASRSGACSCFRPLASRNESTTFFGYITTLGGEGHERRHLDFQKRCHIAAKGDAI